MNGTLPDFHRRLHAWYKKHGRHHLPWRNTDDPYHIWVSEVMLQQTQVKTVLERFYFPFLERFPSVESLAAADLQEVLRLWQGLGYYTRARNLHRAAQIATSGLSSDVAVLMQLPGIGRNTAHAIAAFAFHQPVAVMEANLKRLLCRIFALEAPTEAQLWSKAGELLDITHPFDYNQAMMDLGAMICTAEAPQCTICPAAMLCTGKTNPTAYPPPKKKKVLPERTLNIVLFTDNLGEIFIEKREGKFLHGLWKFAEFPTEKSTIHFNNDQYSIDKMNYIGDVAHAYTHFRLHAKVYQQVISYPLHSKTLEEIQKLPLSRTEIKIIQLIEQKSGVIKS